MSNGSRRLTPGLAVLHGNRLEWLQEAVIDWTAREPLGPLDEEVFLVQSNGIAEWLKMALAHRLGVCAATRVELPGRFLWRSYRALLGRDGAPATAPLDKGPMTWRLMRVLGEPALAAPVFAPLQRFLAAEPAGAPPAIDTRDGPARRLARRLQLAQRLADLYDQYQVYRADWLADWAAGRDVLAPGGARPVVPVPDDQAWQPALWRVMLDDLRERDGQGEAQLRPAVHRRFVRQLDVAAQGDGAAALTDAQHARLPQRVVAFGLSHLPSQTLEALVALSQHVQVLLAVPNPCRFHWADLIEGRERFPASRRRLPLRGGRDLALVPLEQAHAEGHPLLAAWGRQARDFIRLLDAFDDAQAVRERLPALRLDLFDGDADEGAADARLSLLQRVQAAVRDLLPLAEHPRPLGQPLPAPDGSVVFHRAHSAVREVEILHDQLLQRLGRPGGADGQVLSPRDIVVMVPDIEPWAPLIHAVFGQHAIGDARRIPYEITDLRPRGRAPLLVALDWLLRIDTQRCTASELRDLLDVPALARRLGLGDEDRAQAGRWLAGAGVRWGLDAEHRASLGLGAVGEQNTWAFGLRRMLAGYACGRVEAGDGVEPWHDIDPYDEVGGLDAAVAGSLDRLVQALRDWWREACDSATPAQWDARARALLNRLFDPADEAERALLAALLEALGRWRDACAQAGCDDLPVPLAVLREAWLEGLDDPGVRSRFLAGGVVFCTLMPMRAIPFRLVCLLGMNEGDYPRRAPRSDFDLLGLPGQRRPGDRARRDDDRLLMLEAVLAARETLYISWAGRSVRDNTPQPPSVLVAQLRDYLRAGFGDAVVDGALTEHPLQPFSRRYFEQAPAPDEAASALRTYAREWREGHADRSAEPGSPTEAVLALRMPSPIAADEVDRPALDLRRLTEFLRQPVRAFFREVLGVQLRPLDGGTPDDEPLSLGGLEEYQLLDSLLQDWPTGDDPATPGGSLGATLRARTAALVRQGLLPVGALGERWQVRFARRVGPMAAEWLAVMAEWPEAAPPWSLRFEPAPGSATPRLDDWFDGLRSRPGGTERRWVAVDARRLCRPRKSEDDPFVPEPAPLLGAWVRLLVASACAPQSSGLQGCLVGRDCVLTLTPPAPDEAREVLASLLDAWQVSRRAPLRVTLRTALAWLQVHRASGGDDDDGMARDAARVAWEGGHRISGEGADPVLRRLFGDADGLLGDDDDRPGDDGSAATDPSLTGDAAAADGDLRAAAQGRFVTWARQLYGPLADWCATRVEARALPDAAEPDDEVAQEDGDER